MASLLVIGLVAVFDLIAFALAIAAEERRNTAQIVLHGGLFYCAYDKDIATGLGVGSFLFLMLSQVIIMVVSRCLCCGRGMKPGGSKAWTIILFIICWVCFIIAELCLLVASATNSNVVKDDNASECKMLRKGVFGAAAAFVFFTAIVSELFYVLYSRAHDQPSFNAEPGIRMGNV